MTSLGPGTKNPLNTTNKEEEPFTKPSKTLPNPQRTDQHQHNSKTHELSKSLETNPTKGSYRSDRSRAPVRPVVPVQLGCHKSAPHRSDWYPLVRPTGQSGLMLLHLRLRSWLCGSTKEPSGFLVNHRKPRELGVASANRHS
jgi:hypothetical protein